MDTAYRNADEDALRLASALIKQMRARGASDDEIVAELAKSIVRPRKLSEAIRKSLRNPASPAGIFNPVASRETIHKALSEKPGIDATITRVRREEAEFQKRRARRCAATSAARTDWRFLMPSTLRNRGLIKLVKLVHGNYAVAYVHEAEVPAHLAAGWERA